MFGPLSIRTTQITSLTPLNHNKDYENLKRLYADNNQIVLISDLEESRFIGDFEFLHLRRNKIKYVSYKQILQYNN